MGGVNKTGGAGGGDPIADIKAQFKDPKPGGAKGAVPNGRGPEADGADAAALKRQRLADYGAAKGGLPSQLACGGNAHPNGRDDRVVGTRFDDVARGRAGDDVVLGRGGNDIVSGGAGDDVVKGGRGADDVSGGAGDDILKGGRGFDLLFGGAGDDVTDTGRGLGVHIGGAGADTFRIRDNILDGKSKDTIIAADFDATEDRLKLGPQLTEALKAFLEGDASAVEGFERGADVAALEKGLGRFDGAAKGATEFLLGQLGPEAGRLDNATTIRIAGGDSIVIFGVTPGALKGLLGELLGVTPKAQPAPAAADTPAAAPAVATTTAATTAPETKAAAAEEPPVPFVRAEGAEVGIQKIDGKTRAALIKGHFADYVAERDGNGNTVFRGKPNTPAAGMKVVASKGVLTAFTDDATPTWSVGPTAGAPSFSGPAAGGAKGGGNTPGAPTGTPPGTSPGTPPGTPPGPPPGTPPASPPEPPPAPPPGAPPGPPPGTPPAGTPLGTPPTPPGDPEEPEPMDPIAATGRIWGDPHFIGADGGKYDIQGQPGKIYNLLSDQGVQVNGKFEKWGDGGATVVGELGVSIGAERVLIGKDGALEINGETIAEDGVYLDGLVTKKGPHIDVTAKEYTLSVEAKRFINIDFASSNVVSDSVRPHGLWGQSADGDGEARDGAKGKGAQGGGAIENLAGEIVGRDNKEAVRLYEVDTVLATTFASFNRFA